MSTLKQPNALSVDVEDYFQVSAFEQSVNRKNWGDFPSRVEQNTHKLLDIFDEYDLKATFFILGWVADRYPGLVKEIQKRAHEVACHGYSHKLIYKQSLSEFTDETLRAKKILEDISGEPVLGYRAASYSITKDSLWALDVLSEAGFKYDSSVFPVIHDRYGISGSPEHIYKLKTTNGGLLIEYPMTVAKAGPITLPMAGGGYFRLYPYWFSRYFFRKIQDKTQQPFIFYLHPWEIDPNQPPIEAGMLSKFRHYNNLAKCEGRLKQLLKDFKFTTVIDVLNKQNDIPVFSLEDPALFS